MDGVTQLTPDGDKITLTGRILTIHGLDSSMQGKIICKVVSSCTRTREDVDLGFLLPVPQKGVSIKGPCITWSPSVLNFPKIVPLIHCNIPNKCILIVSTYFKRSTYVKRPIDHSLRVNIQYRLNCIEYSKFSQVRFNQGQIQERLLGGVQRAACTRDTWQAKEWKLCLSNFKRFPSGLGLI